MGEKKNIHHLVLCVFQAVTQSLGIYVLILRETAVFQDTFILLGREGSFLCYTRLVPGIFLVLCLKVFLAMLRDHLVPGMKPRPAIYIQGTFLTCCTKRLVRANLTLTRASE